MLSAAGPSGFGRACKWRPAHDRYTKRPATITAQYWQDRQHRRARGFGFISSPLMPDVFFHFSVLEGLDFDDDDIVGCKVRFTYRQGDKGLQATTVRPI